MRFPLLLGTVAVLFATSCRIPTPGQTTGPGKDIRLDLPADFTPTDADFVNKDPRGRFMGIRKFKGRVMKKRDGVSALYVVHVIEGRFKHDPIRVGDVIIGIEGAPMEDDPAYHFKKAVWRALKGDGFVEITRWRQGATETFTLDLNPRIPDLTQGDPINDLHDWQLGPTGINGWLHSVVMDNGASRDARQIKVTLVEKGSPADGKIMLNDVIIGVGGKPFVCDARRALGQAIVDAEKQENQGKLTIRIWRPGDSAQDGQGPAPGSGSGKEMDVVLTLKVLPDPGLTSPYDCPKTEALIDAACNFLKGKALKPGWLGYINALGLLAAGRDDLMPKLKQFAHDICIPGEVLNVDVHQSMLCWTWSYKLIFLCEYYLRTKDPSVLPTITEYATKLAMGQSGVGTWGHSVASRQYNDGKLHGRLGGYGAINQMGLTAMIGLPLARKCGVDNQEVRDAITRGNTFFSYYVDKGAIPYGDHRPNTQWFDDNGKSGSAAVMFDLIGNRRGSQFFSHMVIGSAPSGREAGHTGHFWSHLWGGVGAARSGEAGMTAFMQEMDYLFTLERGVAGNFVFQGNVGEAGKQGESKLKSWDCTGARLLQLCVPRKLLYVTGRDMTGGSPVTPDRIKALFAAGDLYCNKDARRKLTQAEIFELLGDEMPAIRITGAIAMREQNLNCVDDLVAMLDGGNRFARYGACYALKESGYGSTNTIGRLIELMQTSDDLDLRLNAIDALTAADPDFSLATSARPAIPVLLQLAVKRFDIDPRRLLQRRLAFALFDRNGLITLHGIDDIDSSILLPAVRALLTVDDGRARSLVSSIFSELKTEDRQALWSEIFVATRDVAPSGIMFADGVRAKGLELMAAHAVQEGIDLTLAFMSETRWGRGARESAGLRVLKTYGPAATAVVPFLQRMKKDKRKPEQLAEIDAVIKAIEAGRPVPLKSIKPFLKPLDSE